MSIDTYDTKAGLVVTFEDGPFAQLRITGPELERLSPDDRALFAMHMQQAVEDALGSYTDFHESEFSLTRLTGEADIPESLPGQVPLPVGQGHALDGQMPSTLPDRSNHRSES